MLNKKKNFTDFFMFLLIISCRGISSTVRRCIEKETGREFAAKIIDLGAESGDVSTSQMLEATKQEIAILRQVMGHPYISKFQSKRKCLKCKTKCLIKIVVYSF